MFKVLSLTVIVAIVLCGIVYIVGYQANPEFSGSETVIFDASIDDTWNVITNVQWITTIKEKVDRVQLTNNEGTSWAEIDRGGAIRYYSIIEKNKPKRYLVELTESTSGLTGTWRYDLHELEDKQTQVTITEMSTNRSVFNRGIETFRGRDVHIQQAFKSIRVGIFEQLLRQ